MNGSVVFRQLSTLSLVSALAVSGGAAVRSGAASASGAPERVQFAEGPVPGQDVAVINDGNRDQLAKAAELVDFNKGDYAGAVVDDSGTVIIVAVTAQGVSLARDTFKNDPQVEVTTGQLSVAAATQLGLELYRGLSAVGSKIYKWTINPLASSLRVGIFKALTEDEQTQVELFAEKNNSRLEIYFDESARPAELNDARLEDDSPYAGGFRYTMQTGSGSGATGTGYCSGGFGYQRGGTDYILTAGHCFDRGTSHDYMWNTQSGGCCVKKVYAGRSSNTTWNNGVGTVTAGSDDAYHGDLALVNVDTANKQAGDQIWWDGVTSLNKIPVTVRRVPTVGDPVCINGVTSGADCGLTVSDTNTSWTYANGEVVVNGDEATSSSAADCSQSGDSGGSVVYNHSGVETQATAEGIVSGRAINSDGCTQIFTGIEEAIQAWGGNVKFN